MLGVLGGLAAVGIVIGGLVFLNRDLGTLAQLYGSDLRLSLPTFREMGVVLVVAAVLGWLGAYLSVSRHLLGTDRK
jgi:cell division transport system permease protein